MAVNYYIVNSDGEVLKEFEKLDDYVKVEEGDYLVKRKQLEYLQGSTKLDYVFIKVNPLLLEEYCKKYSLFPFLISHINYMENIVVHSNGKFIDSKNLYEYAGVSKATYKRQIPQLIKEDIIHKKKDGKMTYFVVNCWICHRGKKVAKPLYEEFKMSALREKTKEIGV